MLQTEPLINKFPFLDGGDYSTPQESSQLK